MENNSTITKQKHTSGKKKERLSTLLGMTKVNFKLGRVSYIIFTVGIVALLSNYITAAIFRQEGNSILALGNAMYVLPIAMAIFIPALSFSKFLNLGTKRSDFFYSCIFTYLPAAVFSALLSYILRFTLDKAAIKFVGLLDLYDAFGFSGVWAVFNMAALVLFFTCVTHTVTLVQGKWYGYLTDLFLLFWIILFPSIPVFRPIVKWFYSMIIFNKYPILQILSCLVLSAGVYGLSVFPIKKKKI